MKPSVLEPEGYYRYSGRKWAIRSKINLGRREPYASFFRYISCALCGGRYLGRKCVLDQPGKQKISKKIRRTTYPVILLC